MSKWALVIGICGLIAVTTPHAAHADDWTPRPVNSGKPLDYIVEESGIGGVGVRLFRGGVVFNQSASIVLRFDNGGSDRYSMPLYPIFETLSNAGAPQISTDRRWIASATYHEREIGDYPAEIPHILRLDRRTRRVARLKPGKVPPDDWFFDWAFSRDGKRIILASARFLRVYDTVSLKLIQKRAWPLTLEVKNARRYQTATHRGIFDLAHGFFASSIFAGIAPNWWLVT